jgi:hypothetical protein
VLPDLDVGTGIHVGDNPIDEGEIVTARESSRDASGNLGDLRGRGAVGSVREQPGANAFGDVLGDPFYECQEVVHGGAERERATHRAGERADQQRDPVVGVGVRPIGDRAAAFVEENVAIPIVIRDGAQL